MNRSLPARDRSHRSAATRRTPDIEGLCLALADWHAELRRIRQGVAK